MARDSSPLTLRDLVRELAIAAGQTVALGALLIALAALTFAMPLFLGEAVRRLP
jgi:hypothetical protein